MNDPTRISERNAEATFDRGPITKTGSDGVFQILEPANPAAVVIDVSRSGRRYPVEFRPDAPFNAVHSRISMYVDDLLALAPWVGATLLCAEFPITVIDPNRACDDMDPTQIDGEWPAELNPTTQSLKNGAGLIHMVGADKFPLYQRKLRVDEIAQRMDRYYRPYHDELTRLLERAKARHGRVFHLSFHCMSSVDPKAPQGAAAIRPDICLGDRDGTTCDSGFSAFVRERFTRLGYGVSINAPFKGSEIMRRYGSPATGTQSLQVEICKRLFMDEATGERSSSFEQFQRELTDVVRDVCSYATQMIDSRDVQ